MISETIYWGYIEIPYPYLESYKASLLTLNIREINGINFSRLVGPVIEKYKTAIVSFSDIVKDEAYNEPEIIDAFELFLKEIGFLSATLLIEVSSEKVSFFQYVYDGNVVSKFRHNVLLNNNEHTVFNKAE